MTTVRLLLALTLGLLLAAPVAMAAPARGEVEVGSIALAGDARLESTGIDARSLAPAPPTLDLTFTELSLQRIGQQRVEVGGPLDTRARNTAIDESATYTNARVTLEGGAGDQLVALRALGLATAQASNAELRGVGGALLGSAIQVAEACSPSEALYCLDVFGVYELTGSSSEISLGGPVTLLLYGPTLLVESNGERVAHASGVTTSQDAVAAQQVDDAWVVVTGQVTTGTLAGDALQVYSAAPTIRASGITLQDAAGELRVGLTQYRASNDDVEATGDLVLLPAAVERAATHGEKEDGAHGSTLYASAFTTRVSGDIASIDLDGAPAFLDTPAEKAGAAAILLALAGGLAYAWNHVAFAAAALYTRLNKPDILENEVRNRIYDIIVHNPGISAREVHRQSEQSWGTVVYHLRQLERHHLVVSRALGRTRNYYENHGKYRGMEIQLACLQSDRALTLARAIAAHPGITQEQLALDCGFPQPTTSYYVRKLKQAGLVQEQREGRYVKYVPHADLPRFIALSDHQPQVGGVASSGVQA